MSDARPLEVWELPTRAVGRRVLRFAELASTNDFARTLSPGEAVVADFQTQGRGQYGRAWVAPPGSSLMMSARLDPPDELRGPAPVTAYCAVAVAEAVEELAGLPVTLKWPNDLLVGGRKVCGLLIESGETLVAGLGLNLTQSRAEFDAAGLPLAASVLASSGRLVAAETAARSVLARLDFWHGRLGSRELESAWAARLGLLGRLAVAETISGRAVAGVVAELTLGAVALAAAGGPVRLSCAEIRALRADGRPGDSYTG